MAWDLRFDRDDLEAVTLVDVDLPELADGEVLLRVDRVGLTANNVTYAVFGDAMGYWDFFPTNPVGVRAQGRVPLWGFADVESSTVPGVAEGTRVYGYLPTSSHLVVRPAKVDAHGFTDASPHRAHLPTAYNGFTCTTEDPVYDAETEDLQVLYRPLFMTSFLLADFIDDNDRFGASAVILTSASSKTAYGTAFLLDGVRRIGLTSAANRAFTERLGCYDEVVTYDAVEDLAQEPSVLVDIAGDAVVRRRVHERVAPVHSAVVGAAHHDAAPDPASGVGLEGAPPTFFFAPDRLRKRAADWGPGGVLDRHAEAWARFVPQAAGWIEVTVDEGPEGLRAAWWDTLAGRVPPDLGHVVAV